jgi:hypothetical protein
MFILFLLSAFLTMPGFVPRILPIPVVHPYLYEPFLYAAFAGLLVARGRSRLPVPLVVFGSVFAGMILLAAANSAERTPLIQDARPLFDMLIAAATAYWYLERFPIAPVLVTVKRILWASLLLTLAGSTGALELAGRSEVASLTRAAEGADRLITAATYFSLAVVCIALAAVVIGSTTLRAALPFILPGVAILGMSFSRNNILGVGVALLWSLITRRTRGSKAVGFTKLAGLALTLGAVLLIGLQFSSSDWLQVQMNAFGERVVGGLSSEGLAVDTSAQFRRDENIAIIPRIMDSPVIGHGLGAKYKPASGPPESFQATRAPSYAHNFYYWLALKGGIAALGAFLVLVLRPVLQSSRSPSHAPVGAAVVAFAAVSFVAPMPIGFPTAALFGLLLGGAYHFSESVTVPAPDPAKSPVMRRL